MGYLQDRGKAIGGAIGGKAGEKMGGQIAGDPGSFVKGYIGSAPGAIKSGMASMDPMAAGNEKKRKAKNDLAKSQEDQKIFNEGVNDEETAAEDDYSKNQMEGISAYQTGRDASGKTWQDEADALQKETKSQATDAKSTYTNTVQPRLKGIMERAGTESDSAMTLADAGNPNNSVVQGVRGVYDTEGGRQRGEYNNEGARMRGAYDAEGDNAVRAYNQEGAERRGQYTDEGAQRRGAYNDEGASQQGIYNTQAQGVGKQGLADTGVLAALGAQATSQQFGQGGPMTGNQLASLQGQNMSQAGAAYAKAQQRMADLQQQGINANLSQRNAGITTETNLRGKGLDSETDLRGTGLANRADMRSQGLSGEADARAKGLGVEGDMRAQGIQSGLTRSDQQYDRGQKAIDRYSGSVMDLQNAETTHHAGQSAFRSEIGNRQDAITGRQQGVLQEDYNLGKTQRDTDLGFKGAQAGRKRGTANAAYATDQAGRAGEIAAQNAKQGGMMGAAGTVVGGVAGAYFGKSPAAAAAGASVGGAVGSAVGQGMSGQQGQNPMSGVQQPSYSYNQPQQQYQAPNAPQGSQTYYSPNTGQPSYSTTPNAPQYAMTGPTSQGIAAQMGSEMGDPRMKRQQRYA